INNFIGDNEILNVIGTNFTPWSKVFVNGTKVPTTYVSGSQLKIAINSLEEGLNSIVVNQMGSSGSIFRSSNEVTYDKPIVEAPDDMSVQPDNDTADPNSDNGNGNAGGSSQEIIDTPLK
ncbi:MAG: hypothetical protein RSD28_09680, partial [Lachnospiraceae bacterium]